MSNPLIDSFTAIYFSFLPDELASVLSALVWGQKNALSPNLYDLFQETGLLHLVVLSGQNISLLVGFTEGFEKFVGKQIRFATNAFVSLFYLLMFANDPPIVRASIMALITSFSLYRQVSTHSLYILGLTSAIMLFIQPSWLTSVSFWLSVCATFGIIVIYPLLRQRYPHPLLNPLFITIAAQLCTAPIIILAFREISLIGIPMNMLVSFLIEPIMVIGVLLSTVGIIIQPIGLVLGFVATGMLHIFLVVVKAGHLISPLFVVRI